MYRSPVLARRLGLLLGTAAVTLSAGCGATDAIALMNDPQPAPAASTRATVRWVIDGNTVVVATSDGVDRKVRILGIRAPLLGQSHRPAQCGAPEAARFTERLLSRQRVTLVPDPGQADQDFYHRQLRYVRLDDGRDFSVESARAGMSRGYVYGGRPVLEEAPIAAAQQEARIKHRGLWGMCA
ncbi:MAG TPA: thermonuclease family protein [Pseudonocardia sp.]|jgi:micrococcal nuclease|nr:thermonuclease family protein [Pseudonocardia sp.]